MIVKMHKAYIVARKSEREKLLDVLREAGLIHITPVAPDSVIHDAELSEKINAVSRAIQILSNIIPTGGQKIDIEPIEAAKEVLEIQRRSAELRNRLGILHRQLDKLKMWGDVTIEQFKALKEAGIEILFFSISKDKIAKIEAECVEVVGEISRSQKIVAIISRNSQLKLPEEAKQIPLPQRDAPSIRKEAKEIDAKLREDAERLSQLAYMKPKLEQTLAELQEQNEYVMALKSGYEADELFAVQGWVPAKQSSQIELHLSEANIDAAVTISELTEDDNPPTLIEYPRWVKPIAGLFEILGTLPGYREIDLSAFFMIAIPLFAAMLIGDAGYGLIFTAIPLMFYRKLVAAAGKEKTHLLLIVGITTIVWGILSANFFGITPATLANIGGYKTIEQMQAGNAAIAKIGTAMIKAAPLWNANDEQLRTLLIKLSLLVGCIHLSLARIIKAIAIMPDIRSLAEIGWAVFLWAMLGIIWLLFFGSTETMPVSTKTIINGLIAGGILIVLFTAPNKNPVKMIAMGIASSLLPALGAFSDTMSYIRLMAVGLATYYIASAFNGLGVTIAHSATWILAIPILIFGHGLNMGLTVVAIFAHGVRLNMLEFSNNVGVQWSGYPFKAFRRLTSNMRRTNK